ncbi:MAG: TolC family protein [Dysgonamonadaceae bacterium]|jgi:cobalt-zinc-cadmium efflux system outer membrane protein|nr:TolC family protein [Dysgonamonadaceae bacterium]
MKTIFRFATIVLLTLYFWPITSYAQEKILTFNEYLENVKKSNINYLVEKYNVDIAKANVIAAKVFPDPNLILEGANNQNWDMLMGYNYAVGLEYNLELGGKRKARIKVAQSEADLADVQLEDYFRNLRADATLVYLLVLKQKQLFEIQKSSYQHMADLAYADSVRFKSGHIKEVDAHQSRLEANIMFNDVLGSKSDLRDALIQLALMQGDKEMQFPDSLSGELKYFKREFDLLSLITTAQDNRTDLQVALKSKEVSQNNLKLTQANRVVDLDLNIEVTRFSKIRNTMASAPAYTSFSGSVGVPLRFSNANKGILNVSKLALLQSEADYEATKLQIKSDVIQAYHKYMATCQQVDQFNTRLLNSAETILQKKVHSYQQGETSILEVLNAQRTYNDVQVNYNETLYGRAAALIELERATGIWDIEM